MPLYKLVKLLYYFFFHEVAGVSLDISLSAESLSVLLRLKSRVFLEALGEIGRRRKSGKAGYLCDGVVAGNQKVFTFVNSFADEIVDR